MKRVLLVNSNPYYLWEVTKVIVFGSHVSSAAVLGDVDVAVHLQPKEQDSNVCAEQFRTRRLETKRQFRSISEMYAWPEREVWTCIRGRSRAMSLHRLNDEAEVIGRCHRQSWKHIAACHQAHVPGTIGSGAYSALSG
jgi:hypothetical protein